MRDDPGRFRHITMEFAPDTQEAGGRMDGGGGRTYPFNSKMTSVSESGGTGVEAGR